MKAEKSRKLKGSVLFTVVSVMSIMIIFMTATLAVAAAANRRARKTYSSAQTSYTARTAIDSILAAVGTDKDFSKAVRSLALNEEMNIVVNVNNPSMGRVENAKIKFVGTKTVFDPDENVNTWVTRNLYNITADVTIGGETTRITTNILQDPPAGSGGGGGAAFLTWGGADVSNHTYAWGGTYIGMGKWGDKSWNTDLNYIRWYNQQNKLTVLEDKDYLTHEQYHFQNDMALEAPFVVNGNLNTVNTMSIYYTYQGSGINAPGVQIWGDLNTGNNKVKVNLTDELKNYIKSNGYSFYTMPYLYVDGSLIAPNNLCLGVDGNSKAVLNIPLNVFCGDLQLESNELHAAADFYCMDADKVSKLSGSNSKLYKWSNSVVSGQASYSTLGGSFYSKGSVSIDCATDIAGDMKVEGDLFINSNLTVHGDLVVGGTLIKNSGNLNVTGTIYNDKSGSFDESKKNELFDHIHKATSNELIEFMHQQDAAGKVIVTNAQVNRGTWVQQPNNPQYLWARKTFLNDAKLDGKYTAVTDPDFGTIYDFNGNGLNFYTNSSDPTLDDYFVENIDWIDGIRNKKNTPAGVLDYWIVKGSDPEIIVTDAEMNAACITSGAAYPGASPLSIYKAMANSGGVIYPKRAERETLLGLYWPVKGIEHRVKAASSLDPADYAAMTEPSREFTQMSLLGGNITQSCTLTGEFTSTVNIVAGDEDIYVRLLNVFFKSPESVVDGKTVVANTARIAVQENGTGKVYFVLEGKVQSNYDYKDEKSSTKLIKTVYDWQKEFNLEAIGNEPGSREGTIYNGSGLPKQNIDGNEHSVITADATLKGKWGADSGVPSVDDHRDIYIIAPASGEIWVTLDNFQTDNNIRIIVDDSAGGEVYFYVKGNCILGSNGGIISKTLQDIFDSGNKINILSRKSDPVINAAVQKNGYPILDPLKIRMYSAKNASLKIMNDSIVTAYITAIYMDVSMPTVNTNAKIKNAIIYDGQPLSTASPMEGRFGVIGMLNCRTSDAQNDWTLIYVSDEEGGNKQVVDAEGAHAYEAVEYFAFAR
ncbi:MAG: hypothetical protein IKO47_08235 [Ruminococcus sp.]|nr:hypothetical protein [Ruminococcus sp.]